MKSQNGTRMRAASAVGVCLAMLFITRGARAQETKETVTVNDVDRTYLLRLPRGYDREQKYPVLILLHGMNQDTDDMERLTRFDELADKDGIIAVYPSALHGRWNVGVRPPAPPPTMRPMGGRGGRRGGGGFPGGGGYPGGGQSGGQGRSEEERGSAPADDIAFLNQMLDQMATQFSVDTDVVSTPCLD